MSAANNREVLKRREISLRAGVWVRVYGFACFGSKFLCGDEVLYVVAHAEKMHTDLLGRKLPNMEGESPSTHST